MPAQPDPSKSTLLHATTIAADDRAVLIRGASGSGKSGLALQLMAYGADLVADDRTQVWVQDGHVMADVPETILGQIEARGVGVLKAPPTGPRQVKLVVDLDLTETERLPALRETHLLDIALPLIGKSGFAHFPAAILLYLRHGRLA
ncbi:MAG: serine kinase [Pseudomonadota bacterium]